ncbi:thioredoxin [Ferroacidibacillus organovorans]|uniref:Thioredoxin n=1 Tax=Ferroacidibacillus organovorans TaxID=1765683 RepID=A0A162UP38_9BACL|nr:thioredoxin [Ferroacidibacillus organovorans]KYP81918.1 thiol reductase thioredoxin [Ferroacidibacillus organovorans]OAG94893.1 thioredoxin [Ferroacidibacillus organovorans]OPG15058.1 thioredoxin [Ferroacidibacillus organovorans]
MATTAITDATFRDFINSDKPVLVDFWATWCGPCKMMAPVLEEVSHEYAAKLKVGKLDVDQNPQMSQQYRIMSIPTIIVFQQGKPVKQIVGFVPKAQLISQLTGII